MIQESTLAFLRDLKNNNDREWFNEHKPRYEQAKQNVEEVTGELIKEVHKFCPSIGFPEPKRCLFRIYRDTRFSKNKEPYKPNMGALINKDGSTKSVKSGYYLHIEPGQSFASCGVYMPMPPVLHAVRKAIDEDFATFSALVNEPQFKKLGGLSMDDEMLKRVPTGFDKDSPAADYLRLKSFYILHPLSDKQLLSPSLVKDVSHAFKIMQPFCDWLDNIIDDIEE